MFGVGFGFSDLSDSDCGMFGVGFGFLEIACSCQIGVDIDDGMRTSPTGRNLGLGVVG